MRASEFTGKQQLVETKLAWKKRGNKIKRQFRCGYGLRKGRVVSSPDQCTKPIDMKKRFALKRTKAAWGSRLTKKAQKAKRISPASKLLRVLNRSKGAKSGAYSGNVGAYKKRKK